MIIIIITRDNISMVRKGNEREAKNDQSINLYLKK